MKSEFENRIKQLEKDRRKVVIGLRKEFNRVAGSDELNSDDKEGLQNRILASVPSSEYSINMVSKMGKYRGASYLGSITQLIRVKRHLASLGLRLSPGSNDKQKDLHFARLLGVQVPQVYQEGVAASDLVAVEDSVVKPVSGAASRGVLTIDERRQVRSVASGEQFDSLDDAVQALGLNKLMFRVEELVKLQGDPAPDLKVYSFYGQIALVLEIQRGIGRREYCWYNREGEVLPPGSVMPTVQNIAHFVGEGFGDELISAQAVLAENSPVPFSRIDFLKGDNGLYLGEITPHPGRYAEGLTVDADQQLGVEFEKSWARLWKDMLDGKRFSQYFEAYSES